MASLACLTLEVPKLPCFEPYTLAPLAATLTELKLSGPASIQLVLSLIECSRVVRLELSGLRAAALNELLVQVCYRLKMCVTETSHLYLCIFQRLRGISCMVCLLLRTNTRKHKTRLISSTVQKQH